MSWTFAAVGAGLAGVSGLGVVPLIRAIPEPSPKPNPEGVPKEPYVEIAALPRVVPWSVLVCALSGAIVGLSVGRVAELVLWLPLVPVGVALALVDLRTRLLPAVVVWGATAWVVVAGVVIAVVERSPDDLIRAAIGLLVARSFFWLLWLIYPRGMGFGDVRLAAVLGFVLAHAGWAEFLVGLYSAFPMLGVPGLVLALATWDRAQLKEAYPFGPAMLAGALLGLSVGQPLVSALLRT